MFIFERCIMELDRIDREILRILHAHGRLPIVELAKRVNLTTSPCSDRVKRLEKERFITGYHAELNSEKLGLDVQVFIHIRLDQSSFSVFEKFAKAVDDLPSEEEQALFVQTFRKLLRAKNVLESYTDFSWEDLGIDEQTF